MAVNPWEVESVHAFNFFCCPECAYKDREELSFQSHALENHPKSKSLFHLHAKDPFAVKDEEVEIKPSDNNEKEDLEQTNDKDVQMFFEVNFNAKEDIPFDDKDYVEESNEQDVEHTESVEIQTCLFCNLPMERRKIIYHQQCQHGAFSSIKNDQLNFRCNKCSKVFDDITSTQNHVKEQHAPVDDTKFFECSKCSLTFHDLVDLGIHFNNEHDRESDKYHCPVCLKTFSCNTKVQHHIEGYHQSKKINCPECDKVVAFHSLRMHLESVHKGDRIKKPFKCEECDYSTHAKRYLLAHFSKCHKKEDYQYLCDECDRKFEFPSQLNTHKEAKHEGIKPLICDKCGKGFSRYAKHSFQQHIKICGKPRKKNPKGRQPTSNADAFACDECQKTFSFECHLINHHQVVHGNLPSLFKDKELLGCDKCPKMFTHKQSLIAHRYHKHSTTKKVLVKKKLQCEHCEKVFTNSSALKEHVKTKHENDTPFKCDQCQRSYGTSYGLKNHKINLHMQVKCEECGQQISSSFMLKRHKATVHGIKPSNVFQCQHCPLFYTIETHLKKHMIKHHPSPNS